MKRTSLMVSVGCIALFILAGSCTKNKGQTEVSDQYTVTTIAGSGARGHVDGPAANSQFDRPNNIVVDAQGTIYVSDFGKYSVRKITKDGMVSTVAGGTRGTADGSGASAQFILPGALAVDAQDNIYVADSMRIRKITPSGTVTTIAAAAAPFNYLKEIAVDKQGNIYAINNVSYNTEIRKITPSGEVSTFIDTTQKFATAGYLSTLHDIVVDGSGNLFVARDIFLGYEIYKITPSKAVTFVASTPDVAGMTFNPSTAEIFFTASSLECSSLNSCKSLYKVYKLSSDGKYNAIAGGDEGYADGTGDIARFNVAAGISANVQGNLFVADQENNRVRKITKR